MRHIRRLLLAVLLATCAVAVVAAAATANRSIELDRTSVEATASVFVITEGGSAFNVACEVALTMTLNRRIAKSRGAALGGVTRASFTGCRGGTLRLLAPEARAPWPMKYESFLGTLPAITHVNFTIERFGFLLEAFFGIARCLYGGTFRAITAFNPITELRTDETIAVPLVANLGGVECPANAILRSNFRVRPEVRMTLL
jgi:hypothetical protein